MSDYWQQERDKLRSDDASKLEEIRREDDQGREQADHDDRTRDRGERKPETCPDCGRRFWNWYAHQEECSGRR